MSYLCALQTHKEAISWNTEAELNAWTHLEKTNTLFIKSARTKEKIWVPLKGEGVNNDFKSSFQSVYLQVVLFLCQTH